MQIPSRSRFLGEINVIPLVDVVLVLLIIFMITAPLLYRGIDVELPASATNTIKPEERINLTVDHRKKVYLDRKEVSLEQLEALLAQRASANPKVSVYLQADKKVPYGLVVQVMDVVKRAGIEQLGMVTEPISRI